MNSNKQAHKQQKKPPKEGKKYNPSTKKPQPMPDTFPDKSEVINISLPQGCYNMLIKEGKEAITIRSIKYDREHINHKKGDNHR